MSFRDSTAEYMIAIAWERYLESESCRNQKVAMLANKVTQCRYNTAQAHS